MVNDLLYLHSKHYIVVHKKINLTVTFEQVIFERRKIGVVFYNTLYQKKKKNNEMIKLKNQKAEMVSPVFLKAVFDFCCFPASRNNKQIKPTFRVKDKLFIQVLNALCFRFKANWFSLLLRSRK